MDDIFPLTLREETDYWLTPCRLPPARPVSVTVVIPVFAAEATLARAIQSAVTQTLRDIEVIIVDDASTDSSWSLIMDAVSEDSRVRALRHKQNHGKAVAMNHAVSLARGRWLAVLDADDWYHPDRLKALVDLGERRQVDLVADNQLFFDGPADTVVGTAWPAGPNAWELSFDDFLIGSNAYETFNLGMLKPILRGDFMSRTGLRYEDKARHGQDFFYLLQFYLAGGRAVISDTPFYYYTQPFGLISRRWSHQARKRYDFQNAFEINERYLQEAAKSLAPRQLHHLTARNQRIKMLEYYYRAKDALTAGNWFQAIGLLFGHPRMLGYLFRRLYGRFMEKPGYFLAIHHIALRSCRQAATGGPHAGRHGS